MKVISILLAALAVLTMITLVGYSSGTAIPVDQPKPGLCIIQAGALLDQSDSIPSKEEYPDPLLY